MGQVAVNSSTNQVAVDNQMFTVEVITPQNTVIVPVTNIETVEVITPGPQGAAGASATPSGVVGSIQFASASSFAGSPLFTVDPNLGMFVTGGLFVTGSINFSLPSRSQATYLVQADEFGELSFVDSSTLSVSRVQSGSYALEMGTDTGNNAMTVYSASVPVFSVQSNGVLLFGTASTVIQPVAGGFFYSGSNFYVGV